MDMGKSLEAEMSGGLSSAIDYDVFLNFRGLDTRQGFADILYHDLLEANIRAFFDEEELHVGKEIGDELPMAIEKSKIYVPIFSKGYASSPWCLRELTHMVECTKSKPSEKEIMPIFYDVEPRDVKLKSQRYVGALQGHEEKFGRQTRLKWEDALKSVAKIKGWELKKQGHWKFIKSVIQEIVMKLKTIDIYVTEHIVGMDDRVEDVMKLLDVDSGGMRFVLIHGMGGIGKTTLAKVVFNKLNSLFSHSCFLGNVRESSLGLVNLQKQLLCNMFGLGFSDRINDVDDGIKMIVQRLSNRKIFIVLDGVDDEEQLKKLAIKHISFGSGSRIIITTRKRNIVEANQTLEYEVKPLDSIQSLELFCRHAFGRNSPPDDYVSLSRQVVSTTGGLPLALEAIGSSLCRQNKAEWVDVLDNLREILHEKVRDKLKISYNALSYEQKQIFLDIACMFVDEDKTNAFYMWQDCGFFPDYSIQVLVYMSLIKIADDNKFYMHDQLRVLGRNIVCGDTRLMDPRKQNRIWVLETANNIIRTEERKEAIEAVCLGGTGSGTYTSKEFSRLPNIRFLKLFRGELDGDFENQLSKLRYLSWHCFHEEFLAINFHPRNLVVLDLSYSFITEDWAGWSQIKVAKKLKVLDLSYCKYMTRTPNFSDYLSLERLILKDCISLIEVDGSLENLKYLIYFNANGCTSLRELPEGIEGLEKLKYLYLSNCKELRKLPESFARVASLVELDLSYTAITRLPDSIGNLEHLSILKLQSTKINALPSFIGNLQKLKSLVLSCTNIRELPVSIGNMESLLELDVSDTQCLQLPESIGDLSRLKVINISDSSIRELPQSIVALKESEEKTSVATVELVIGIDDQVKDLIKLLEIEDEKVGVRIVGIYGSNGIGKTTIAKAVYERISSYFDSCSFLAEIGETAQNVGGIQFVQTKLISDILERDGNVASFKGGMKFFLDVFRSIKVLIVLDDVEEQSHVNDLVGDQFDWFGSGSRIILTSENGGILQRYVSQGLARTYEVTEMDNDQALELFCKHAFGTNDFTPGYPEIQNRIIKATGQVPFAIEVMGSFLRGKTIEVWRKIEDLMKQRKQKSQEILKDCREILKICYEALDEKQKQIFWDIAWFANGVDSRIASYMWPNRDLLPSHHVLMPLAKIGGDNMLWMHKLLKRLSGTIDEEYPGRHCRLYMHVSDLEVINRKEGIEEVEVLCFDFKNNCPHTFTEANFKSMPNIRFLQLDHASMSGNFANVFPKLRWLRWHGCPRNFEATELNLTELVILDLSWSKVTEEWGGWREIKMKRLKVLNLTGCTDLLISPTFSSFPNLEILILERCSRLVHLDRSVGDLKNLLCLNLKSCTELNRLPTELGTLTALKELLIDESSVRDIPLGGDSRKLETLSASNCLSLSLPDGVGELAKLRRLSFRNCRWIRKLPESIGQLGNPLEELDISGTGISELPDSFGNLQRLRVLKMDYCFISKFPSFIWRLQSLEEIHASSCRNLRGEIPGDIRQLINLRILRLRYSSISSLPPEIKHLSKLETLDVLHCDMLNELPELPSGLVIVHAFESKIEGKGV